MTNDNLTITFDVDRTPDDVFAAVTNVRGWWSRGLVGKSAAVGDEFTYQHGTFHRSTHRVVEAIPGKRVVWSTLDANLSRMKHPGEWIGTEVRFEIEPVAGGTRLRFTHVGLTPGVECFDACTRGWGMYVGDSLRKLITTGVGAPDTEANERGAA